MMQKYETVSQFMADLSEDKRAQVEELRNLIEKTHPGLKEHIKWNAPSYVLDGEDRITFNLMNKEGVVKLILHMGATRKENKHAEPILNDETGLVEWSSDIRGTLSFRALEDITGKREAVTAVVKHWLSLEA